MKEREMKDEEDRRDRYVSQLEAAAVEIAVDTVLLPTWEEVRERAREGAGAAGDAGPASAAGEGVERESSDCL